MEQVGAVADHIKQHVISVVSDAYTGDLDRAKTSWAALVNFENKTSRPGNWFVLVRALRRGFSNGERHNEALDLLKNQFATFRPKNVHLEGLIAEYLSRALDSEARPDRTAARNSEKDLSAYNGLVEEAVARLVQCAEDRKGFAMSHAAASCHPGSAPNARSRILVQKHAGLLVGTSSVPRSEAFEMQYRQLYMELTKSITPGKPSITQTMPDEPHQIRQYEIWRDINRLLAIAAGASKAYQALGQAGLKLPKLDGLANEPQVARDFASIQYLRTWDEELSIGLDASYKQMWQRVMQLRGLEDGKQPGFKNYSSMRQSGVTNTVTVPASDPVSSQRHYHNASHTAFTNCDLAGFQVKLQT